MTLSFYTWSEFEKNCGYSRLYGGVNFPDSVTNIKEMARQMGRRAIDFVRYSTVVTFFQISNHFSSAGIMSIWPEENTIVMKILRRKRPIFTCIQGKDLSTGKSDKFPLK